MPNIVVDELIIKLSAQNAELLKRMDEAERKISTTTTRMSKNLEGVRKGFSIISTAVAGAAVAVGAGVAVIGKRVLESADQLDKLNKRLGVSTEFLSEMRFVMSQSGVSFEAFSLGIQRMQRRVAEAAKGTGEAVGALEELGLSSKRLKEQSLEDQFLIVAESLSRVKSDADKTRLAMKLFDSEGVALLQTMNNGAAGIEELRKKARELGLTLKGEEASAIADFNDSIDELKTAIFGAVQQGIVQNLPKLKEFVKTLQDNAPAVLAFAEGIGVLVDWFIKLGEIIGKVTGGISNFFGSLKNNDTELFPGQKDILGQSTTSKAEAEIERLNQKMRSLSEQRSRGLETSTMQPESDLKDLLEIMEMVRLKQGESKKEFEEVKKSGMIAFEEIENYAFISTKAWSDQLTQSIMQGKEGFRSLGDFAINVLNQIMSAIIQTQVVNPLVNTVVGSLAGASKGFFNFGGKMPQTELLSRAIAGAKADGGDVTGGLPYMIGERGPEMFIPRTDGYVMNNRDVRSMGNGNRTVVVNQNMNFSTGVLDTVRTEIAKAAPIIATQAKNAVYEDINNGTGAARVVGRR